MPSAIDIKKHNDSLDVIKKDIVSIICDPKYKSNNTIELGISEIPRYVSILESSCKSNNIKLYESIEKAEQSIKELLTVGQELIRSGSSGSSNFSYYSDSDSSGSSNFSYYSDSDSSGDDGNLYGKLVDQSKDDVDNLNNLAGNANTAAKHKIQSLEKGKITPKIKKRIEKLNKIIDISEKVAKWAGWIGDALTLVKGSLNSDLGEFSKALGSVVSGWTAGKLAGFALGAVFGAAGASALLAAGVSLAAGVLADNLFDYLFDKFSNNVPPNPKNPLDPRRLSDPLVLDLNGDGVVTTGLSNKIYFDNDGDGFKELSGFISPKDGMLVLDRNKDGKINDGSELFGDATPLRSGNDFAADGFEALSEYDDNKDGVIDENDAIFDKLQIFQDINQNGITDAGELFSLSDKKIKKINLNYKEINIADKNGNIHSKKSSFETSDGKSYDLTNIFLNTDRSDTKYEILDVPKDIAALPDIKGYGTTYSLHQAMVRDKTGRLKALVKDFITNNNRSERLVLLEKIIYVWTGQSEDIPDKYDRSKEFKVLDSFFGTKLGSNVWSRSINRNLFRQLKDSVYLRLMKDTHLHDVFRNYGYNYDEKSNTHILKYNLIIPNFVRLIENNPAEINDLTSDFIMSIRGVNPYNSLNLDVFEKEIKHWLNTTDINKSFSDKTIVMLKSLSLGASDIDNWIIGGAGNDTIYGLAGNDYLDGEAGDDKLYGGAGNDKLDGGSGDDILDGGAGNDDLDGGAGDDYLDGGVGNDDLDGGAGDDILDGGAGNDNLDGGAGINTYKFAQGFGNDTIGAVARDNDKGDIIEFGEGISSKDIRFSRSGYYEDNLLLSTLDGKNSITITDYFTYRNKGKNTVTQIKFADGKTVDISKDKGLVLTGTDGDNVGNTLIGSDSSDTIYGLAGNDVLFGEAGNDILDGGAGNDDLGGGSGDDILDGGAGNDKLYGGAGDDVLDGGAGNDYLDGGAGSNTYRFAQVFGNDTINAAARDNDKGDIIEFGEGISAKDIRLSRSGYYGDNLLLSTLDGKNSITITDYFYYRNKGKNTVTQIKFADGKTVDISKDKGLVLTGTDGDNGGNTLTGSNSADTINDDLSGGSGNDDLYGGAGNDKLDGGAGNDYLDGEAGDDKLYGGVGDDWLDAGAGDDNLVGGDGNDILLGGAGNDLLDAGAGNDKLYGGAGDDKLSGGAGNDDLDGGSGDDILDGGAGNDDLDGGSGDDILDGGAGNDYLDGGAGINTYKFAQVFGNDTIEAAARDNDKGDIIEFGEGISAKDIRLSRSGDNLLLNTLNFYGKNSITINNYFYYRNNGKNTVTQIKFANGKTVDISKDKGLVLTGTDGDNGGNTLTGSNSADSIYGLAGNDVLDGGAGNDKLDGGAGNDYLYGGAGDDVLDGGAGNDYLDGGAGINTYKFAQVFGNDTIKAAAHDNDKVDIIEFGEGISSKDIHFSRSGYYGEDLLLSTLDGKNSITINNYFYYRNKGKNTVTQIKFADGKTVDISKDKGLVLTGTDGDNGGNTLTGSNSADTINDILYGGAGNDELYGGAGNDKLDGGAGNDELDGGAGNDYLDGGAGNDKLYGEAGDDWLDSGAGNDKLSGGSGNDSLYGGAGDDYLDGGSGNDKLDGGAGDDWLDGGAGDDYLDGGAGINTYKFAQFFGNDTIKAAARDNDKGDIIKFGERISSKDIRLSRSGDNLLLNTLSFYGKNSITINNYFYYLNKGKNTVTQIKFADGEIDISKDKVLVLTGTDDDNGDKPYGNYTLVGSNSADSLYGGAGNDYLYGGAGNDKLSGGSGNDYLYGGAGDDILDGGAGNDYLDGGAGINTYKFAQVFGNDTIKAAACDNDKGDIIEFGEGISAKDIRLSRSGYNRRHLLLSTLDGKNSITINNYFYYRYIGKNTVTQIKFADGEVIDISKDKDLVLTGTDDDNGDKPYGNYTLVGSNSADSIYGGAGNDTIYAVAGNDKLSGGSGNDKLYGGAGDDILDGGAGNDDLYGGAGDDILDGGAGNDYLDGGAGSNTYKFAQVFGNDTIEAAARDNDKGDIIEFAKGISSKDIRLSSSGYKGEHLLLSTLDGKNSITINNYFYYRKQGKNTVTQIKFADGKTVDISKGIEIVDLMKDTSIVNYVDDVASVTNDYFQFKTSFGANLMRADNGNIAVSSNSDSELFAENKERNILFAV